MKKRFALAASAALIILTIGMLLLSETATPVSAQEVLNRSAEVQAAPPASQGIYHSKSEGYFNFKALFPDEALVNLAESAPERTIIEDYFEPGGNKYQSVIRNADTGQIVHVSGQDETHLYLGVFTNLQHTTNNENHLTALPDTVTPDTLTPDTATLTVYRSPIPETLQTAWVSLSGGGFDLDSQKFFEQAQQSPQVEYVGQETWVDGRMVHVLRFKPEVEVMAGEASVGVMVVGAVQSSQVYTTPLTMSEQPPLISTMYFDVETYELLETRETVERAGETILVGYHRQLVNELLPVGTSVAWDFSDLPEISLVDDPQGEHLPLFTVASPTLSREEFISQVDFTPYLLPTVPEGYTLEIMTMDGVAAVRFDNQATEPPPPPAPAKFYTISYRDETGHFVEFSGPEPTSVQPLTSEATEVYEAANGLKFYVRPDGGADVMTYGAGYALGPAVFMPGVAVSEPLTQTLAVEAGPGFYPALPVGGTAITSATQPAETLVFGLLETPEGFSWNLVSNLPLAEVKTLIEQLTPAQ